jgi:hypothetical protein
MQKKKAARLAGFIGALCASGALVGIGVAGTGAYFTDSHNGTINASTGHIKVAIDPSNGQLNFENLLPGDYATQRVNYTAQVLGGSGASEDIWLVFPNYGQSGDAFASTPVAGPTPLGRYGHFALTSTGGASFTSYNLALDPNLGTPQQDSCGIDANGEGGSGQQAANKSDTSVPYCAPAKAILLQAGMTNGQVGHVDMTFGYTPLLTGPQDMPNTSIEQYQIVATQHGVRPDDPNNS